MENNKEDTLNPSASKSKEKIAILLVLLATIIWGSQYIIIKEAVEQVPPLLFQAIRHAIAFFSFLPIWGRFRKLDKVTLTGALISSIVFCFLLSFLTIGLGFTTSNKGAFLATLYVVFTPFVGYLILKSPLKKFQLAAVFIAIIGMGVMIFGNAVSSNLELAPNIGDLLVIIGAIFNAFQIVLIEKYVKKVDIFLFVMSQMLMISVFMFGASLLIGEEYIPDQFTPSVIWSILYIAILATTITLIIQTWAQKYIDATRAAILYALEPVFAIIFGVILGGENITLAFVIGAGLMLVGILWSSVKKE